MRPELRTFKSSSALSGLPLAGYMRVRGDEAGQVGYLR